MSFLNIIKREFAVAFSKDAQPVWFRIIKYTLLGTFLYFFWGETLLWIILLVVFVLGLALHFWYRYKTAGWTKSYGLWKHETERKNNSKSK